MNGTVHKRRFAAGAFYLLVGVVVVGSLAAVVSHELGLPWYIVPLALVAVCPVAYAVGWVAGWTADYAGERGDTR